MTENCVFCNVDLNKSITNYENHIKTNHNIVKHQQLVISLFLLDEGEMNEILTRLQPRIDTLKETESPSIKISNIRSRADIKKEIVSTGEEIESNANEDESLLDIQNQLEFEDSSDEEDDVSNVDAS